MNTEEKKVDSKSSSLEDVDFDTLLQMAKDDAGLLDKMTDEQISELRKRINPYGRTIEGNDKYTCLSITNLSEQYMKKFLATSLIGFLYRQCDEYLVDDGEPTIPLDDYNTYMTKYEEITRKAFSAKEWFYKFSKEHKKNEPLSIEQKAMVLENQRHLDRADGFSKRIVVRNFLNNLFQFNPDKHVRSAYSDNPLDPERVRPAQVSDKKVKKSVKVIKGRDGKTMRVPKESEPEVDPEEAKRSNSSFVKHIPPADTFHRWNYYTDVNYEEIRTAVQDLYCDKPDLEFAINPYKQFNTKEETENFINKHKNEVIADILTLTNGKWNLCGSFKKNRDRINFYNEKTVILEEIFKQMESDKLLGKDLMRKRVKRKKAKNIKECGPDPEEFKKYKKDHPSSFESMGAENVSRENKTDVKEDKVNFKIHEECPYDAVQVDIFDFKKGGMEVRKSEFFTEAEDPKKMESKKTPS